jgi:citrate synthase
MIKEETLKDIFKPRNLKWRTNITKVEPNKLITRGYPQEDLIENISFSEMIHLIIKGKLPSKNEAKMLGAILVSFCDHGVTPPSTQAARIMASTGSPLNACIAGGILAFGKNHAGAIEEAMKILQKGMKLPKENIDELAEQIIHYFIKNNEKIFGFGHRYHNEDPRAIKLMKMAKKYKCFGKHSELATAMEKILFDRKRIKMNIDGANGAILSDMGFNWSVGSGIFMIGRLPGILTHINEEKTREAPFRKLFEIDEIHYDGNESNF